MIVPLLWLKVPEFERLPAIFNTLLSGAVSVPVIVTPKRLVVEVPEIVLVPLKTTVPLL